MSAFITLCAVLVLVSGFLWRKLVQLRRVLSEMERRTTVDQSSGVEERAAAQEAVRKLENLNDALRSQVADLQQELGALSYSVSHDLRAPLRSVRGFAEALVEDYGSRLDGTAHEYLRRVQAGAQHMDVLIDDLLGLARLTRAPLHKEPVDFSALAQQIALELAATEPLRRVEWQIQPGLVARGDRALLSAVLRHLLGNAWKFSGKRMFSTISIRSREDEREHGRTPTVYEVRDNGVGFDMQYAGKLFGAFQRMCAAEEFPGRGIGLAAVQRIVRRHGGSIQAVAELDQGAVFSFTLGEPLTTPPTVPARPPEPEAARMANVSGMVRSKPSVA